MIVYEYEGQPLIVHADKLPFASLIGFWMDPVSGAIGTFGRVEKKMQTLTPPVREGETNDWALIIADESQAQALVSAYVG